jgi:hypothetical protein
MVKYRSLEVRKRAISGMCVIGVALTCGVTPAQDATLTIGTREEVTKLFSWPNCKLNCPVSRDLPETVRYYLDESVRRDGFASSSVSVQESAGKIVVTITGSAANIYRTRVPLFLSAGTVGEHAAESLKNAGQWRNDWRFFLPLGLALKNNPTVQLLHFPPTSVLEETQNYLAAHTTSRWADLLVRNGANEKLTDQYQAIIDIAPVAAPADGGPLLSGVYDDFTPYTMAMLKFWLSDADTKAAKPMVVFGGPVRDWIEVNFGKKLGVTDTAQLDVPDVGVVQIIASNHPSMLYNVAKQYRKPNGEPTEKGISVLSKVMQQDLVVACWQVRMAAAPSSNSNQIAATCTKRWTGELKALCMLVVDQAFNIGEPRRSEICVESKPSLKEATNDELEKLSRALGL